MTSYTKTIEKPEITLIVGPDKVKIDDISLNLKKCMSADGAEELAVTLQNLAIALRNAAKAAKALDDRRDDDKATYALMLDNARAAFGPDTRLVIKRGTRTVSMTVISDEWGEDELKGKNFDELQDELAALIDSRAADPDETDDDDDDEQPDDDSETLPIAAAAPDNAFCWVNHYQDMIKRYQATLANPTPFTTPADTARYRQEIARYEANLAALQPERN